MLPDYIRWFFGGRRAELLPGLRGVFFAENQAKSAKGGEMRGFITCLGDMPQPDRLATVAFSRVST